MPPPKDWAAVRREGDAVSPYGRNTNSVEAWLARHRSRCCRHHVLPKSLATYSCRNRADFSRRTVDTVDTGDGPSDHVHGPEKNGASPGMGRRAAFAKTHVKGQGDPDSYLGTVHT